MVDEPTRVTVRPGVGMLALFPSMSYKPWYALSEFVDNALQSWLSHRDDLSAARGGPARLRIEVIIDRSAGTIEVIDNAAGIFAKDVDRAFTPAAPPADASGLSQFGIGMKSAAAWYARRFSVTTTALGEAVRRNVTFDIPAIVEAGADTIPLVTVPAPAWEHGTRLVLSDLNHPAPTGRTLGKIRDYLSSIYRRFVNDEHVEIVVGGERLKYEAPRLLEAPRWNRPDDQPLEWRKNVAVHLPSGRTITGWAGLLATGNTVAAGFALLYRGKVVQGAGSMARDASGGYKPHEVFGAGNSFESQRLIGELDVSELDVTHTKDALVWDDEDESAFLALLQEELDAEPLPLLRMARNYRSTARTRAVQAIVQEVVASVAQATEQTIRIDEGPRRPLVVKRSPVPGRMTSAAAPPVEQTVPLGDTAWRLLGEQLTIRVVDEPRDLRAWIRVIPEGTTWVVTVNRAHPFTESFANLPGMDLEPILRLAIAVALVQIVVEREGAQEPWFFLSELNRVLSGPLADRAG